MSSNRAHHRVKFRCAFCNRDIVGVPKLQDSGRKLKLTVERIFVFREHAPFARSPSDASKRGQLCLGSGRRVDVA